MAKVKMLAFSQALELSKAHPYFYEGMVKPNYSAFSEQFELVVESDFSSVEEAIRLHHPDLIMVDPGPAVQPSIMPDATTLRKLSCCPIIFYCTLDAHYHGHHGILNYLEALQPDGIFAHDYFQPFYPDKWRDLIFFIPNSYNHNLFRNLHIEKDIMCGFYGAGFFGNGHYPWRKRMADRVLPEFPSYVLPRPTGLRDHGISGEPFVQVMNRTQFGFGCTSIKDIPVKKVFEIPACGSLLMTNRSSTLEQLGFEDGVNCAFVETDTVLQTIRYYLDNPNIYEEVCKAGQQLVEQHHQAHHRQHILNWYQAYNQKASHQKVVQTTMMGEFAAQSPEQSDKVSFSIPKTELNDIIERARDSWRLGDYLAAKAHYGYLHSAYPIMTESVTRKLGACLHLGDVNAAEKLVVKYLEILNVKNTVEASRHMQLYIAFMLRQLTEKLTDDFVNNIHVRTIAEPFISESDDFWALCQAESKSSAEIRRLDLAENSFVEHLEQALHNATQ